mmetsp:Transcript_1695/g.5052  ORF Transcript_1695/g.5052 Transcript_1695/m.5052 type:complete len:292 (-) Transcript_1695:69-944(-)
MGCGFSIPLPNADASDEANPANGVSFDGRHLFHLDDFITDDGKVMYGRLSRSPDAVRRLQHNLRQCFEVNADELENSARLAFYINAHNLWSVYLALFKLRRDPRWSGHTSFTRQRSAFSSTKVYVAGRRLSLRSLAVNIICRQFQDPRVHAALSYASMSSPPMQKQLLSPGTLEEDLDAIVARWFSHGSALHISDDGHALVNPIFHWFRSDFGRYEQLQAERPVLDHGVTVDQLAGANLVYHYVIRFSTEQQRVLLTKQLKNRGRVRWGWARFDWRINRGEGDDPIQPVAA